MFTVSNYLFAGILITGGDGLQGRGRGVEVYNPLTNKTCQLPDLPDVRMYHSLCGGLLCGGGESKDVYSKRSCLLLDPRSGRFDCTKAWLVKGSHQNRISFLKKKM